MIFIPEQLTNARPEIPRRAFFISLRDMLDPSLLKRGSLLTVEPKKNETMQ